MRCVVERQSTPEARGKDPTAFSDCVSPGRSDLVGRRQWGERDARRQHTDGSCRFVTFCPGKGDSMDGWADFPLSHQRAFPIQWRGDETSQPYSVPRHLRWRRWSRHPQNEPIARPIEDLADRRWTLGLFPDPPFFLIFLFLHQTPAVPRPNCRRRHGHRGRREDDAGSGPTTVHPLTAAPSANKGPSGCRGSFSR